MHACPDRPLELKITRRGQAAVVHVSGSVSVPDAERLGEQLGALAAERTPIIVLDLAEMDFISSLGLGAIISAHLKCRHHQGQIRLVSPIQPVRDILETTRLTKIFPIYQSVDQALAEA